MILKIFQLNIWAGKFLPDIISFIKKHEFDVILLQEVANGPWIKKFPSELNFEQLTESLKERYTGVLAPAKQFSNIENSYFGNATFYRHAYPLLKQETIWLQTSRELTFTDEFYSRDLAKDSRNALSLTLSVDNKDIVFINTHMMWGPNPYDADYKHRQADVLINYIKTLQTPFVLSGDFNMTPETRTMKQIGELGTNLTTKYGFTTTLNAKYTKAPEPYAIDYIFTSSGIKVISCQLIDMPDLSDHYGLVADVEI